MQYFPAPANPELRSRRLRFGNQMHKRRLFLRRPRISLTGYVCYNDACCRLFSAAELNDLCEFEGWQCGSYLNCGRQNVDCGSFAAGSCDPLSHKCCTTCEEMGYECGDFDNGCGSGDCGSCPASPVYPFSAKQCVDHKCVN